MQHLPGQRYLHKTLFFGLREETILIAENIFSKQPTKVPKMAGKLNKIILRHLVPQKRLLIT